MTASGIKGAVLVAWLLTLSGCTTFSPLKDKPSTELPQQALAPAWMAAPVTASAVSFDTQPMKDPLLGILQKRVAEHSISLAQVKNSVVAAQAALTSAQANSTPQLNFVGSGTRSASGFLGNVFISNQYQAGLQSSWEIDLFGVLAKQNEAALARLQQNRLLLEQVQTSVRTETALLYVQRRLCEAQAQLLTEERQSAQRVLDALIKTQRVGLRSQGDVLGFQAQVVEYDNALTQQNATCEAQLKALVALTGMEESALRARLAEQQGQLPALRPVPLQPVPAEVLTNRPDVQGLMWAVDAASADLGAENAARFPRLSLTGSIAPTRFESQQFGNFNYRAWSLGPSLSLPILDGGRRAASIQAAQSAYNLAKLELEAKVRDAVKEVEQALVDWSAQRQQTEVLALHVSELDQQTQRADKQFRAGLINGLSLEQDRRTAWATQRQLKQTQAAQLIAMLNLHRALGGTWTFPE